MSDTAGAHTPDPDRTDSTGADPEDRSDEHRQQPGDEPTDSGGGTADIAALEAALQALRGRVDEVDRADEAIEQRADAALAAVDRLEARLDRLEARLGTESGAGTRRDDADDDARAAGSMSATDTAGADAERRQADIDEDTQSREHSADEFDWVEPSDQATSHETAGNRTPNRAGRRTADTRPSNRTDQKTADARSSNRTDRRTADTQPSDRTDCRASEQSTATRPATDDSRKENRNTRGATPPGDDRASWPSPSAQRPTDEERIHPDAPTASEGPAPATDERSLVDRLRDRL